MLSETRKQKILTIDDEQLVRRSFKLFLEDLGYQVLEAKDGRSGIELASAEQPDLILLDLRMPEIDGLQILSMLQLELPETPVVVISGTGEIHDVVEALRRGACDYLTKPITNMAVLEHAINRSLERSRLRKENLAYQESLETEVQKRTAELEEACRALNTSNQTLESLFQVAPLAVVLIDKKQQVTLWNRGAEKLFGWNEREVHETSCPFFEELERNVLDRLYQQGLSNCELKLRHRSGDSLTVNLSSAWLDEEKRGSGGIVMLLEDVTEKKRLRAEADRANRLASLGQLSAGVAHEINNPNGLVLLNMPTLRDVLSDALEQLQQLTPDTKVGGLAIERARELIPQIADEMEDGARRIRQIVEDLKGFSQRDSRSEKINFDLNRSVEKATRLAANNIRKKTDRFKCELEVPLPQVSGKPQRIEQVIVNLLVNACEALPNRDSELRVVTRTAPQSGQIELQVIDQGVGISAEDMKHITDPFFTTRREAGGTGLGLSVSARIVREHSGRLQFESKPGKGTCATLSLPAAKDAP